MVSASSAQGAGSGSLQLPSTLMHPQYPEWACGKADCTLRAQGTAQSTGGASRLPPSLLLLSKEDVTGKLRDQSPRPGVYGIRGSVFPLLLRMSSSFLPFVVVWLKWFWVPFTGKEQRQVGVTFLTSGVAGAGSSLTASVLPGSPPGPVAGEWTGRAKAMLSREGGDGGKGLIMTNRDTPFTPSLRNSKGFRSSVPGTGDNYQIHVCSCVTISQDILSQGTRVHGSRRNVAFIHKLSHHSTWHFEGLQYH